MVGRNGTSYKSVKRCDCCHLHKSIVGKVRKVVYYDKDSYHFILKNNCRFCMRTSNNGDCTRTRPCCFEIAILRQGTSGK